MEKTEFDKMFNKHESGDVYVLFEGQYYEVKGTYSDDGKIIIKTGEVFFD